MKAERGNKLSFYLSTFIFVAKIYTKYVDTFLDNKKERGKCITRMEGKEPLLITSMRTIQEGNLGPF